MGRRPHPPAAQPGPPAHRGPAPRSRPSSRATGLVRDVDRPDLLLLAALLHDIGKVAGAHDHSAVGAPIAARIAHPDGAAAAGRGGRRADARARAPDPDRPGHPARPQRPRRPWSRSSAAVGGSRELLELLRALTEADASAAGPAAWTDWRAQLLRPARRRSPGHDGRGPPAGGAAPASPRSVVTRRRRRQRRRGGAARGRPHPRRRPPGRRLRPGPARACSPTPRGCSPRTASWSARRSCAPTRASRPTSGRWSHPGGDAAGRRPRSPAACAGSPTATARRCSPWSGAGPRAVRRARSPPSGSPGQTRALVVPHASDDATVIEVRAGDRVGLLHEIGMTLRPGRARASAAPTSPPTPGRRSTRSTSPSSAAGACRRPAWRRRCPC